MNKDHILQITDSHSQQLTCWSFSESSFTPSEKLRLQLSSLSESVSSEHTYIPKAGLGIGWKSESIWYYFTIGFCITQAMIYKAPFYSEVPGEDAYVRKAGENEALLYQLDHSR